MKSIQNIKSEDILTLDIETVRYTKNFSDLSDDWKSAWSYKNKQDGEVLSDEKLSELWLKSASLYAEFSKICAISLTYLKGDILKCKNYSGTDEVKILTDFAKDIGIFINHNSKYRLMGHASRYFDFPFMAKRYIANALDVPGGIDESNAKPWEMKNLDTNELWRSFGTGPGSSLQALCTLLNIPISKDGLVGDEVGEAYFNGKLDEISIYCSKDTVATFNVFRTWKKEPVFAFEDVSYVK